MYQDVRGSDGRKLFRYDPERNLVEIRHQGTFYTVDLNQYRPQADRVDVVRIVPDPVLIDSEPVTVVI